MNIELPGPLLVFDINKLGEAFEEIYNSDYYPISIITDSNNEMLQKMRADHPDYNIDCLIVPVRYLTTFLA